MLLKDQKTLWAVMRVDGGDGVPDHPHVPYPSGSRCLELLGWKERKYSMSLADQVLEHQEDYPEMRNYALAWYIMMRAVGDAGMTDRDLERLKVEFPSTVPTVGPNYRTLAPGLDEPSCLLETFLFRRDGAILSSPRKHWASLSGTKLLLFADWNKGRPGEPGFEWSDQIPLSEIVSVDPATDLSLRYCFRIATPCRPERALLQCVNEEEFQLWLGSLYSRLRCVSIATRLDALAASNPSSCATIASSLEEQICCADISPGRSP